MDGQTKPRRAEGLTTRELPGDDTVLVLPSGRAVVVNAMASIVVNLSDGARTVDAIADEIHAAVQGASVEQVRADVQRVVSQLVGWGCLEG